MTRYLPIRSGLVFSLIVVAVSLSQRCLAQKGLFTFKDSTEYELTINSVSDQQIFFDDGITMDYEKIYKVQFYKLKASDKLLVQKLRVKGITVGSSNTKLDTMYPSQVVEFKIEGEQEPTVNDVIIALRKTNNERWAGGFLQLIGGLGLITHFVLQNNYVNDVKSGNTGAKSPSLVIPIVASGLLTIGIGMNISSGHLKFKGLK